MPFSLFRALKGMSRPHLRDYQEKVVVQGKRKKKKCRENMNVSGTRGYEKSASSSAVVYILTSDCFLNAFSFDHIAALYASARAK